MLSVHESTELGVLRSTDTAPFALTQPPSHSYNKPKSTEGYSKQHARARHTTEASYKLIFIHSFKGLKSKHEAVLPQVGIILSLYTIKKETQANKYRRS